MTKRTNCMNILRGGKNLLFNIVKVNFLNFTEFECMEFYDYNINGVKMRNFLILMLIVIQSAVAYSSDFWVKVDNQASNDTIYCSLVDKYDNIYIGTKRHTILKSSDEGKTWVEKKKGLDSSILNRFWCLAADSLGNIYASVIPKGIYKSTDQGESWNQIISGINLVHGSMLCFGLACSRDNIVYVSLMDDQVYKSTNFGETWTAITSNSIFSSISVSSITLDQNNYIYCSIGGNSKNIWGIYKSMDFGTSWVQILDSGYISTNILMINSLDHLFSGTYPKGILRSTDHGNSFQPVLQLEETNKALVIAISERDHLYAFYENKGIFRSIDNGSNWSLVDSGLISTTFFNTISDKNGYIYLGTWGKGLYRSKEPMPKFYINSEFDPSIGKSKLLAQGDTLDYNIKLTMKDSVYSIANADVSIINEINSDVIKSTTDSLGEFRYKFSVPMNRDTGEYKVRFYFSKFGFEKLDTIIDKIIIKKIVSVEEQSINQPITFLIIPNPASDQITIEFQNFEIGELQIELSDIAGKVLIQKHDFNIDNRPHQISLKTTNLINGEYLISITQEDKKIVKKLIINK